MALDEKKFKKDLAIVINCHGVDSLMEMSDSAVAGEIFDFLTELKTENDLEAYLKSHEFDIAIGENDFDELYDVFVKVIGRKPKE